MKLIKFKTRKDCIYINPESIAFVRIKDQKDDITIIGFNSGDYTYANSIAIYEPIKTVLSKLNVEEK
jgi:hypothetical protein